MTVWRSRNYHVRLKSATQMKRVVIPCRLFWSFRYRFQWDREQLPDLWREWQLVLLLSISFFSRRYSSCHLVERMLAWPLRERVRYRANDLHMYRTPREQTGSRAHSLTDLRRATVGPASVPGSSVHGSYAPPPPLELCAPPELMKWCVVIRALSSGATRSERWRQCAERWSRRCTQPSARCTEGLFQKPFECRCLTAVKWLSRRRCQNGGNRHVMLLASDGFFFQRSPVIALLAPISQSSIDLKRI